MLVDFPSIETYITCTEIWSYRRFVYVATSSLYYITSEYNVFNQYQYDSVFMTLSYLNVDGDKK